MARRRPTEPTANPARGVALVVVAVVIGLFLLRNGIDASRTTTADRGAQTDAGAVDGGADDATTSTTAPAVRTPAEVRVVVLNDSGVNGAAGRYSAALAEGGYQMLNEGATASLPGNSATTQVLHTEGFDQEAVAVAQLIGAPVTGVQALGTAVPGDVGDANVIVVLGTDIATATPTTTAT